MSRVLIWSIGILYRHDPVAANNLLVLCVGAALVPMSDNIQGHYSGDTALIIDQRPVQKKTCHQRN